jgi:hypothetical protein
VGRLAKFAAIVAALSLLWVLVTPAPDELPCTIHKSLVTWTFVASAALVLLPSFDPPLLFDIVNNFASAKIISSNCTLLC